MVLTGCDDLFTPAIENTKNIEYMDQNASFAEGILANAYTRLPCSSFPFSEVATDDAVSNLATNGYRLMASGSWTSQNNPMDMWNGCRAAIMYINSFLSRVDKVAWANDETARIMYRDREKGEALGLRALYMYYLLRSHGGYSADGELLGVPIVKDAEGAENPSDQTRATFAECMRALYDDCDSALALLPTQYADITDKADIPVRYRQMGATVSQYNRVFGSSFNLRMCGSIVEAYRAKATLLAASPAFAASGYTYAQAADAVATVLDRIGGVSGMDKNGWKWYAQTSEISAMTSQKNPKEVLWRAAKGQENNWEKDNFPPSLYGAGRINPTQNFVDCFPSANGYPITDAESDYDPSKPYEKRDPRLTAYVVVNGSTAGVNNHVITTASDGTGLDALNNTEGYSTRTGYYLRKLLRQDVNLDPIVNSTQFHYVPRVRYTEMFLDYAEAANEAWGPTAKGTHGYSAYDIIKAIRSRAGVGASNGDAYLESIKDDKDKMRDLIRNERRIELSFEGFRFWDIRRWGLNMNETAKGIQVTSQSSNVFDVDTRNYKDYMQYGPIPYSECLKYPSLKQNKGW